MIYVVWCGQSKSGLDAVIEAENEILIRIMLYKKGINKSILNTGFILFRVNL